MSRAKTKRSIWLKTRKLSSQGNSKRMWPIYSTLRSISNKSDIIWITLDSTLTLIEMRRASKVSSQDSWHMKFNESSRPLMKCHLPSTQIRSIISSCPDMAKLASLRALESTVRFQWLHRLPSRLSWPSLSLARPQTSSLSSWQKTMQRNLSVRRTSPSETLDLKVC